MNNVIQINTKITIQNDALIADDNLMALIEAGKEVDKMLKAQQAALSEIKNQIRLIMGEYETAISPDGCKVATYNWIKGAEGVDKEALRIHFADVYEVVKTVGEPTRRLELK